MDIFEELHKEHEEVAGLIATLEEKGRDDKTFETLRTQLTAHSKAEEQVLYKRLETEESVRDTVLEGYEEHKVVVKVLSDMAKTTDDEEKFAAKLAVLKENVEHHVEEEEGTLFEGARPLLAEGEPESLYEEFEAAKSKLEG
jgi:hemerythrin superfamily protein